MAGAVGSGAAIGRGYPDVSAIAASPNLAGSDASVAVVALLLGAWNRRRQERKQRPLGYVNPLLIYRVCYLLIDSRYSLDRFVNPLLINRVCY
jgi:hypothetical protein